MTALPVTLVSADDCQLNWESLKKTFDDLTTALAAASSSGAQPGDVKATATTTAPGWLLCDGTSYLRTAQPALFGAIGTTYGAVDGTHFTVPNLLGRVPMGAGTAAGATGATAHALGASGGEETHLLTTGESGQKAVTTGNDSPDHSHGTGSGGPFALISDPASTVFVTNGTGAGTTGFKGVSNTAGASARHQHAIAGVDAGSGHNNLQPYQAINWWIKS